MFAEDKVFFVPVDWTPTEESLKVGTTQEDFPSPMVEEPAAEVSPPAGDESAPWWVRELPDHVLGLSWVEAANAKWRMANHPAPPETTVAQPKPAPPMPKLPSRKQD
jgi:hypothetical protein